MTTQTMSERLRAIDESLLPEEYHTALQIVREARQRLRDMSPPADIAPTRHPLETGRIDDDWLDDLANLEPARETHARRAGILSRLIHDGNNRAEVIRASLTEKTLQAYHVELCRLLEQAKSVSDELGDADTANKAINADLGPQWKRLIQLAEDYDTLRAAQVSQLTPDVIHKCGVPGGEPHSSDLYLKNLDEIWPSWRTRDAGHDGMRRVNLGATDTGTRYEPWPPDRIQLMLWLVRSDAEPWIPTRAQLNTLDRQRLENASPTRKPEGSGWAQIPTVV